MALTKIVQQICRTLWLGMEVSAPVLISSPPTQKVLQSCQHAPCVSCPHPPPPNLHGVPVTAQPPGLQTPANLLLPYTVGSRRDGLCQTPSSPLTQCLS